MEEMEPTMNTSNDGWIYETLITEKMRPKSLDSIILLDRVRDLVDKSVRDSSGEPIITGNMLFYGTPGTGKTSLTRILSKPYDTLYINASAETGIDTIRDKIINFCNSYSLLNLDKKYKVVVLEECDGLSIDAWKALRAVMEKYHKDIRFILNCNYIEKVPKPIFSRVTSIAFDPQNSEEMSELLEKYVAKLSDILNSLNISYDEDSVRGFILVDYPDFRKTLTRVQSLLIEGKTEITPDNISHTFNYRDIYDVVMNECATPYKNYTEFRTKYENVSDRVIIEFGKSFVDYLAKEHEKYLPLVPLMVIKIQEHQNALSDAPDKFIVLMSLIYSLQILVIQYANKLSKSNAQPS